MWEWLSQMIANGSTGQALAGGADRGVMANLFDNPGGVFSSTPIVGQAAAAQGMQGAIEGTQVPAWKDPAMLSSLLGNFGAALAPQGSWQQALGGLAAQWGGNQLYGRAAQNMMAQNQGPVPQPAAPAAPVIQTTPLMTGQASPQSVTQGSMLPGKMPTLLPSDIATILSNYGLPPVPMIDQRLISGGF